MSELHAHIVIRNMTNTEVFDGPGYCIKLNGSDYSTSALLWFSEPEDALEWILDTQLKIIADVGKGGENLSLSHEEKNDWEAQLSQAKKSDNAFNDLNTLANEFYNEHQTLLRYDPWAMMFHHRIYEVLEAVSDVHT